jgi:hypothetical protein
MLSSDEILTGLGLVIVLTLACRLVAHATRLPAIVLLLPVGFAAGAVTDDVHPDALLGDAFQPLVTPGVGLILLSQAGVSGGEDILPLYFIAIFATVGLYGLTAAPVARLLGLAKAGMRVVLVVGGQAWGRAIAKALETAGLGVRLWTGRPEEQAAAREDGLAAGNARLGVELATREEELEEVIDALLVSESDDFNALAAYELRRHLGHEHVFRLPAGDDVLDLVSVYAEGSILFDEELTYSELTSRFEAGAALVRESGELAVVTAGRAPLSRPGDTKICLRSPG